jgi:hypothetical protein
MAMVKNERMVVDFVGPAFAPAGPGPVLLEPLTTTPAGTTPSDAWNRLQSCRQRFPGGWLQVVRDVVGRLKRPESRKLHLFNQIILFCQQGPLEVA